MVATTLKEALTLGASSADLLWDFERGWITFPKHEPDVEGHVHDAVALAIAHGHSHVLEDYGMYVTSSIKTNYALASLCSQYDTASRDSVFNDTMKDMFSPEKIDKKMSTIFERKKFSEACGRKLLSGTLWLWKMMDSFEYGIWNQNRRARRKLWMNGIQSGRSGEQP